MIKTLNLIANAEKSVSALGGDRCRIQNRTSGTLYVSDKPGIAPCADGVMSIPSGRGDYFPYSMVSDTVYLLSESGGNVEVSGEHYYRPFDSAAVTGGKAVGNPVVMDGLQGGVPFSEITIEGKNIFDGSLTVGMVSTGNGTIVAVKKYISTTNLISVKPNTRYIAQNSENKTLDAVVYFDKNKSVIGHTYTSAAGFNSFTTPDKCRFIMWRYLFDTDQDDTSALTNIQLEEGDVITSYEPPITGRELTLNVCGKNLLKYPYKAVFPIANQNGLSATENDGIITIDGEMTASSNNTQILLSIQKLKAATYTISGCAPGGDTSVFRVRVGNADTGTQICGDIGSGMSFTLSEETNVQISIQIFQNAVLNNAVFKPQLELGTAATDYEPYSGAEYKLTPDSNPYTVPTDIRQLEGRNTLYIADSGARLSVRYSKANAELKRIWDKLDELTTAIVVSSGE